jgi:endoglucanase
MKKKLHFLFILIVVFASCNQTKKITVAGNSVSVDSEFNSSPVLPVTALVRFSRGMNFSGWFETDSAQGINFTKYIEQDFADVKKMGADVIRLPVKMHSMTGNAPDYRLDPLLLKFLDMAVSWAEKYGLYIIIDNHSFHPVNYTPDDIDKVLLPVWAQIAQRYKDRSEYIVYEILNEPHGISDRRWGEVQGMAIDTIRRIDQKHTIIVGGTDYNSIGKLSALPRYSDSNLIYTFHFYDPHIFTHQGATWGGEPTLGPLAGVPFPYDRSRMPRTPSNLRGTWIESSLNDYRNSSSLKTLNATLDKVVAFSKERNVPVFCGEFGVYLINSRQEDRVRWYEFTTDALDRRKIARTSWDYFGGFGIFNTEGAVDINYDLNTAVVRAMGFTPPAQSVRSQEPVKSGFSLFDDYTDRKYVTSGYWGNGFSMFDTNAAEGEYSLRWGNASQYSAIWFSFANKDFTVLAAGGYFLEFKARTEGPVSFDIRFVNPENASSIPWRIRYTINQDILPPDGKWHTIRVPLSEMQEHGAWINATQQWVGPKGEFSWSNVSQLEFAAEHGDITNNVWFDSIKITR